MYHKQILICLFMSVCTAVMLFALAFDLQLSTCLKLCAKIPCWRMHRWSCHNILSMNTCWVYLALHTVLQGKIVDKYIQVVCFWHSVEDSATFHLTSVCVQLYTALNTLFLLSAEDRESSMISLSCGLLFYRRLIPLSQFSPVNALVWCLVASILGVDDGY